MAVEPPEVAVAAVQGLAGCGHAPEIGRAGQDLGHIPGAAGQNEQAEAGHTQFLATERVTGLQGRHTDADPQALAGIDGHVGCAAGLRQYVLQGAVGLRSCLG